MPVFEILPSSKKVRTGFRYTLQWSRRSLVDSVLAY